MANSTSALPLAAGADEREAHVCGIDLTGFTRWVDDEVSTHGAQRLEAIADDLSAFLSGANAILDAEGFALGSLLGDGLLAVRVGSDEGREAAEARIMAALEELEPNARLGFGEGMIERRVFTGLPGTHHAIIAGEAVRRCYRALEESPRAPGTRRPPSPVRPSIGRFASAEIRRAVVGFLAFRAPDFIALGDFIDRNLAIWQARALASGGEVERLTYDDDALLIRFAWPEAVDTGWVETHLAAQAEAHPAHISAGWGAAHGPVFRARLAGVPSLTGEDLDVAQGPAINHAAKRAKTMLGQGMPAGCAAAPRSADASPPPTPLLGRESELAWIRKRIDAGRPLVVVSGEAGIGKSSLLKMAVAAMPGSPDVIETLGRPGDVLEPLGLWQAAASTDGTAPIDTQFASVKAQLAARMAHGRCLVVVDDLQWADVYSRKMIDELVRDVSGVTILAAGRPGAADLVDTLHQDDLLSVSGMAGPDIDALARMHSGLHAPTISALAGGNPFLAVQLALGMRTKPGRAGPVSPSAVIDVRLARLAPSSLAALRLFAIFDRDLDGATLERVCREAGLDFDADALPTLYREQFLTPARSGDRFQFAHRLIQQRVFEQIPPSALLRISAVLGRLSRGRLGTVPALGVVGQHLRGAQQWERAAVADFADAERALAIHAHGPAAELFARATEGFERVRAGADRVALARAGGGLAAWGVGNVAGALDAAKDAAAASAKAMTWRVSVRAAAAILTGRRNLLAPRIALTLARQAALRSELGYFTGTLPDILAGGLIVSRLGDDRTAARLARTRSLGLLALGLGLVGLKRPATAIFHRCQRAGADQLPAAYAYCAEALYRLSRGEWREGDRCLAASEERLGTPRDAHLHGALLCVRALSLHMRGETEAALVAFDALLELGRRRENLQFEAWALYGGAMPLIASGKFARARSQVEAAKERMTGNADALSTLNCSALGAQLAWIDGDAMSAVADIETCLDLSRTIFPANFGSLDGFTLPAIILADILGSPSQPADVHARARALMPASLARSRKFAARCAIGNPRLAIARAMLARSEGSRRRHEARAVALSARFGMPLGLLQPVPANVRPDQAATI